MKVTLLSGKIDGQGNLEFSGAKAFGTAKARSADPTTSHMAAERVNKGFKLTFQRLAVLREVQNRPGFTAKGIGAGIEYRGGKASWAHKRMADLDRAGLVERKWINSIKERTCWITPKGIKALEEQE